jgi:hypothetical protein
VEDIDQTVASADAVNLWRLAVREGVPITSSAVKISYSHPEDVSCAGKTVILKKLRKHLRIKHAHRVGGDYYNKIPSAEEKANAIDALAAASATAAATATEDVPHEKESQAVPLLPRMTLTDDECVELKRACGSFVTRKTRTYPGLFHWREMDWLPYDVDEASGCLVLVEVMTQLDNWKRYGKPTCYGKEPFNFRVTGINAIYSDTPLMIEVTNARQLHAMTIPDAERYRIIKPAKVMAVAAAKKAAAAAAAAAAASATIAIAPRAP